MKKRDFKDEVPAIQIIDEKIQRAYEEYIRRVIKDDLYRMQGMH